MKPNNMITEVCKNIQTDESADKKKENGINQIFCYGFLGFPSITPHNLYFDF